MPDWYKSKLNNDNENTKKTITLHYRQHRTFLDVMKAAQSLVNDATIG
jgi:hypothetical protein